jgi:acyl carrier protein
MPPSDLEQDVARLIVESLQLEVDPADIDPDAPLFRTGLGLDSIDALELALAISRRYGIELRADDEQNGKIFGSLRLLAGYIDTHRK